MTIKASSILTNVIITLSLLIQQSNCCSQSNAHISEIEQLVSIPNLLIYEDSTNNLSINQILKKDFIPSKSEVPNLGITKSTFWVKIPVTNKSKSNFLILNLSLPIIDYVEFFHPTSDSQFSKTISGEEIPFANRKHSDPYFLFDLDIPNGQSKDFYLKIRSTEGVQLPIFIGTTEQINKQIRNRDLLSGIYFGIMFVMILYNLFIYFSVKDKSYLYYVLYIILILLTQTSLQGYPYQYLWPNFPIIAKYSLFVFPSLVGIASLVFMNVFLKVKNHNQTFFKISIFLFVPYIVSIIAALFQKYKLSFSLMEFNAMIVSLFMLYVVFRISRNYNPAKYFLAAWVIFLIGVIIFILKDLEILPYNNYTRYTMQIGSAIETVLLSFALAARINVYKKEKEEAQEKTLHALQENEKIINEQNEMLEQKVQEKTKALQEALKHQKDTQVQLIESAKMSTLGQLTAGIAHEINNPINFVSSNINPLEQDLNELYLVLNKYEELDEASNLSENLEEINALKKKLQFNYLKIEIGDIIAGIKEGADRTIKIVSGLKNFSRLDEADYQKTNINLGVESTLMLINSKLDNITLTTELCDLPLINCYPSKLNQVFMNLIDNAINAVSNNTDKKPLINITTFVQNNDVVFKIKDNGVGMDKVTKDKMFEPFFTTRDVGQGTGLGLSIVYGIVVKQHKGSTSVYTTPGKGSSIIIKIPIK